MTRRFFLAIAAILTLSAGLVGTPAVAQDDVATCCFTFHNTMHCTITFCIRTPSGPVCVTVPGNTTVTVTTASDCTNPTLYVVDACNNVRVIPPNGCTVANLGNCCPKICLLRDAASKCWQITTSPSPLCYACPFPDVD